MMDNAEDGGSNPFTEPERRGYQETGSDEYRLMGIARGRMFCLAHGRECYRRIGIIGDDEWVCPDERHQKPIQGS